MPMMLTDLRGECFRRLRLIENAVLGASRYEALVTVLLCGLFASSGVGILHRYLFRTQSYPDFIAGYVTWVADSKIADLATLPMIIGAVLAAIVLFGTALVRLDGSGRNAMRGTFVGHTALWCIPWAIAVGHALLYAGTDPWLFALSAAGVTALGVAVILSKPGAPDVGDNAKRIVGLLVNGLR